MVVWLFRVCTALLQLGCWHIITHHIFTILLQKHITWGSCDQSFRQLVHENSRTSANCTVVRACYKCGGRVPVVVFTRWESKLSYCYKAKSFIFHWIFIYLWVFFFFFLNSVYPLFTFTCRSFGKLFVYKNYPLWFIWFFCQIWYRMCIRVWAAVHKLKKHERCFYRTCWKKISCSTPDANRIFKCTLTDMFHCIYFPPLKKKKKDSKKNVTSGHSVQRNIVTRQKHHTPYRHSVHSRAWYRQGPWLRRLLCDYSGAPSAPCGCSAVQKEIYDVPPSYCRDTMQILEEKSEP